MQEPESAADSRAWRLEVINRDIDRYIDLWKHADSRLVGTATPFLAIIATLVPAVALIGNTVKEARPLLIACIPFFLMVTTLGTLLAVRLLSTSVAKRGYFMYAAILRQALVDEDPSLGDYLAHVKGTAGQYASMKEELFTPTPGAWLVAAPVLVSSAMLAGVSAALFWWGAVKSAPIWGLITCGAVAGGAAFFGLLQLSRSQLHRAIERVERGLPARFRS